MVIRVNVLLCVPTLNEVLSLSYLNINHTKLDIPFRDFGLLASNITSTEWLPFLLNTSWWHVCTWYTSGSRPNAYSKPVLNLTVTDLEAQVQGQTPTYIHYRSRPNAYSKTVLNLAVTDLNLRFKAKRLHVLYSII